MYMKMYSVASRDRPRIRPARCVERCRAQDGIFVLPATITTASTATYGGNGLLRTLVAALPGGHRRQGGRARADGRGRHEPARRRTRVSGDGGGYQAMRCRAKKFGASCWVKVPAGKGLTTHPYRVLCLRRSRGQSAPANKAGEAYTENPAGCR